MDVTAVVTAIGDLYDATGPVTIIGGAMVLLSVTLFGWRIVRRLSSGRG